MSKSRAVEINRQIRRAIYDDAVKKFGHHTAFMGNAEYDWDTGNWWFRDRSGAILAAYTSMAQLGLAHLELPE